ncbi:MAG: tetratricopeptide repeat protein [Phycisphaerales bacterium]|nr:tetratricopeptide repeat protein [Phycisphaerales bacterium]
MSPIASKSKYIITFLFGALLFAIPHVLFAQNKQEEARNFLDNKEYAKAALLYKELFSQQPDNKEVYQDYLMTLMGMKDYKHAADLVTQQLKRYSNNPNYLIDLGNVYKEEKKDKKANELFENALQYVNGDDLLTQQMANNFSTTGNDEWAIKVYERAIQFTQSSMQYSSALARLYNRSGDVEKAIKIIIESSQQGMPLMNGDETIETTLLEIVDKDAEKQKKAQKAIIKLVIEQPDNYYYTNLLTWIFSVQDNWDQAFIQVQALEKRSTDKGRLLMEFAANAAKKNEYEIAEKAYNIVIGYGNTHSRYKMVREALLQMQLSKIENNPSPSKVDIANLSKAYTDFLSEYPDGFGRPIINDYALLEAQYDNNMPHAIELLNKAISQKMGDKFFMGNCKLQLGDYYIITGKVWDAALMYAQVDKAFREDAMGEEARFRNAKLSYYQNDFEQAQGQLSVLKASTSELIANDALFLSVLITENVPPDSNLVPLKRFAFADLLLFQNKDVEAEALLDSIAHNFPKNPLADDILLLRSKIALKHKNYPKAIDYLKQVIEQHGKDVLADDALMQLAAIQQGFLKQKEEAQKYYEQLILDYPGSSFIRQAREQLKLLGTIN